MNEIAFTTIHGSRLYGLDHAGSDKDSMIVYNDNRKALHKKTGEDDVIHVGIYDLLEKANSGSHQFLEAVFSEKKIWEDETFRPLIENVVVPGAAVRPKFERTIKKFCYDSFKYRRHAVRLTLFLNDLTTFGRADPTLWGVARLYVDYAAEQWEGKELYEKMQEVHSTGF